MPRARGHLAAGLFFFVQGGGPGLQKTSKNSGKSNGILGKFTL